LRERAEILKRWKVENKSVLDIAAGLFAAIAASGFTLHRQSKIPIDAIVKRFAEGLSIRDTWGFPES